MLRQIPSGKISSNDLERVWYTDRSLDLFIWVSGTGKIKQFQFSYDKPNNEKSVNWDVNDGLSHSLVDDGKSPGVFQK